MRTGVDWSVQLYSARNFQPWSDVLKTLGDLGYRQVEGFDGVYDDPAGLRGELDRNGLTMPTAHFSVDMLESGFEQAASMAKTLGVATMISPYLDAEQRPVDAAGWTAFGQRLGAFGAKTKKAGFGFAWHNHDFEFVRLADGSIPLQHLLDAAPEIGWEIDVAWIVRCGADPVEWIDRYASRIVAVHVKDIAPEGAAADEDGWADVGHGAVDWRGLVAALRDRTKARNFIMEHDNPSDFRRFARRSLEAAENF